MYIMYLLITAFLPAFVPACIAVKQKISFSALAAAFFAAAVSVVPVLVLQSIVHSFLDGIILNRPEAVRILFNGFITAALTEESVKAAAFSLTAAVFLKIRNARKVKNDLCTKRTEESGRMEQPDAHHAGIVIALFFGFVFGGFENIFYGLRYPTLQLLRLCSASLVHGALGVFYVRMIRAETKRKSAAVFIAAVCLHGLYNFFILLGGLFILPAAAVIGIILSSSLRFASDYPIKE